MSLLGSIFGDGGKTKSSAKQEKKKESSSSVAQGLTGLFTQSSSLPDRPQHETKPRKQKRKKEEEEPPKKRRKPKKVVEEETPAKEKKEGEEEEPSEEQLGEDPESRTIFVGNLPLKTTSRKSLATLFKDCGAIASTRIRGVPVMGIKLPPQKAGDQKLMKKVCVNTDLVDYENSVKETVQGYVVFKEKEAVKKALELNNVLVVEGRRIRVDHSTPSVDPSRSVFIGNLPYAADEKTLQDHFVKGCDFEVGEVEGVRIIRDKETYQCKGFGYVLLKDKSLVPTALKMHESTYMKRPIRVLVCGKRFKNKKGLEAVSKRSTITEVKGTASAPKETVTVGAFRRILSKQKQEATKTNKRKRGEKKTAPVTKKSGPTGLSKRAALDKKVDKRVKKIEKRLSKGMGKTRR